MKILFKTHFSIGKSILTLDKPEDCEEGGPDSIFKIAKDYDLKELILVDDCMTGLPEFLTKCEKMKIKPVFGLRLSFRNSASEDDFSSDHKNIIFAKDGNGCKILNKIFSRSHCSYDKFLLYSDLKEMWNPNHLEFAIPFYDSFIHVNNFSFANAVPDLSFCRPTCFLEHHKLAFDDVLREKVIEFSNDKGFSTQECRSVYYRKKEDIESYMTYRIICNRTPGRNRDIGNPGLDHFCSNEFSYEQ